MNSLRLYRKMGCRVLFSAINEPTDLGSRVSVKANRRLTDGMCSQRAFATSPENSQAAQRVISRSSVGKASSRPGWINAGLPLVRQDPRRWPEARTKSHRLLDVNLQGKPDW